MSHRSPSKPVMPVVLTIYLLCLGALIGLVVLSVFQFEFRWFAYILGGCIVVAILAVSRQKERLLWATLVLALQFDVSFKILFGYDLKSAQFFYLLLNGSDADHLLKSGIIEEIKANDLEISDLGFFGVEVFAKIAQKGAFYLSRTGRLFCPGSC